jgi:hypothetical protein
MARNFWFLNRFLTSWRDAINRRFPKRTRASEGTIGNAEHSARSSEHNPDRDGSVDAFDMDVNLHGAPNDEGDAAELREIEALKADFQKQPGAQLWIHRGWIANKAVQRWKRRKYTGANKHGKHVHWQSDGDVERKPMVGGLADTDEVIDAINHPAASKSATVPAWPHKPDFSFGPEHERNAYSTVYKAQARLRARGWRITVDGHYGPKTVRIVKLFQAEKKLSADGRLGPNTWRALWATPVTGG